MTATIKEQLEALGSETLKGSGQSYEVYQAKFSAAVDSAFPVAAPQRELALRLAKVMGYRSPAELAADQASMREDGYCCHGIDPDCCPCGCGDLEP